MTKVLHLRPEFVEKMPEVLEDGIIYISEPCRLALHNCCCGCGEEVSTPLGPTEYTLRVVGGEVTVHPSIGNHDYPCASHYVIRDGSIIWAGAMTREAIEAGRTHDRYLKRGEKRRGLHALVHWLGGVLRRLFG